MIKDGEFGEAPQRRPSARHRRAMSAIARPSSSTVRPFTASRPRRPYSAYTKKGSEDDTPQYDAPTTSREWWRYYVKETPNPGSYRSSGFLDDLQKQRSSYGFRDSSRVKSASHQKFERTGKTLLPGAYMHNDFLSDSAKKKTTFGFKAIQRDEGPKIGHGYLDKDMDTNPNKYDVVDYSGGANERDEKTASYKSQVKRTLSAPGFRIVKGPGPGRYESTDIKGPQEITSVFKSKVGRFDNKPSKVPGPGAYSYGDSPFGYPKPVPAAAAVHHMKKKHGISVT